MTSSTKKDEAMVLFPDHSYSMNHLNHSVKQPIDGEKKKWACELCLLSFARLEIILHVEKLPKNIIQEISGYSMIPKIFSQIYTKIYAIW